MQIDPRLKAITEDYPYPLLFASVSGAHLYGFPSPDSDYDLRGVHLLPLKTVLGLGKPEETIIIDRIVDGLHLDLVSHDARFYFTRLLNRNGSLLDQIFSPLVVATSPAHDRLREISLGCLTTRHSRHYLGLAQSQWEKFTSGNERRVKPLLYVYRSLLCGIHLMRSGEVEPNLRVLNKINPLLYLDALIQQKTENEEKAILRAADIAFHEGEYNRLVRVLEEAAAVSDLPEYPTEKARADLNTLLLDLRLKP